VGKFANFIYAALRVLNGPTGAGVAGGITNTITFTVASYSLTLTATGKEGAPVSNE
jgi:hypothetical protein